MTESSVERKRPDTDCGQPLVIEYTNLLHQYRDPEAKEVREFRSKHSGNTVFQKRADILDKVFRLKEELTNR